MVRAVVAAVLLLAQAGTQDMPVARLSGGAPGPTAPQTAPSRPRPTGQQLPPLSVTQIEPLQITLDSPRRLTLSFAEPRPIDEILELLTTGTPFSVALDADVNGVFRGELKQLTLREALATLLAPLGLDYTVQGTVIRVRRRQLATRVFEIDLLNVRRGMTRTAGGPDATLTTSVLPEGPIASVEDGVKALLSEGGRVHLDARAGLIQVTDFSDRLERVALYVEALQLRQGRQVRLQAQAIEVTLHDGLAIDWQLVRERLGLPRDSPDAGIAADPAALRSALAAQGDVRLLWAPDITALNNEPALMRVGGAGGSSLTMIVVPQIAADGVVQMSVSFQSAAVAQVSDADTTTRVMDGHTALFAGLLRPQGAPPAPPDRVELVLLLRPRVVTPASVTGTRD